jgi:hypothetical protein
VPAQQRCGRLADVNVRACDVLRWSGDAPGLPRWLRLRLRRAEGVLDGGDEGLRLETAHGPAPLNRGDWVLREFGSGNVWCVRNEFFRANYEIVTS